MPITQPPVQQPPTVPPVQQPQPPVQQPPVYVPYPVGTPQNPSTSATDLRAESQSSNDSESSSDSSSVNSASQTNINYTQNSNRVEVDGIKIPTTTLSIYGGANDNGYGPTQWNVGTAINISLDGKKKANSMLDKRIRLTQLQYERELAGACASIDKDNYEINPNSIIATELAQCNTIIRKRKTVSVLPPAPPSPPKVNPEIELLRKENAELRQQLFLILQKLDNHNTPVNGGF